MKKPLVVLIVLVVLAGAFEIWYMRVLARERARLRQWEEELEQRPGWIAPESLHRDSTEPVSV